MPLILGTNSIKDTGYTVANSCRFNSADSADMIRTPDSESVTKFTFSVWFKRCKSGGFELLWNERADSSNYTQMYFEESAGDPTDGLAFMSYKSGSYHYNYKTNRLFRDFSAWYHVMLVLDTTQGVAANRIKLYVNGTQETSFHTSTNNISADDTLSVNSGTADVLKIGSNGSSGYFNGYISEVVYLSGYAQAIGDLGEFDEDSPTIWKPKDPSGLTFGTAGYYLDFEDSGDLGDDESGNTNDFTERNLAAVDQCVDSPTNNFCVMNSLDNFIPASTFSEGNCKLVTQSTGYQYNTATFGLTAGKWYYEMKLISESAAEIVGIAGRVCGSSLHYLGYYNDGWGYHSYDGKYKNNNTGTTYGDTWHENDKIIGVYIDLDANKIYFAQDGTIQNSGTGISITDPASVTAGAYFPAVGDNWNGATATYEMNFGNPTYTGTDQTDANGYGSFEYNPSTGTFDSSSKDFLAICTKNLGSDGG